MTTLPLYKHEFPDFDYDVAALVAELPGWEDASWHNDTMPKATPTKYGSVNLWFDYANPALSEFPEGREAETLKRFALTDEAGCTWYETDDWAAMREWIITTAMPTLEEAHEAVAQEIAMHFTENLKAAITDVEWKEMVAKNKSDPAYQTGACASQDYCDANMPMSDAFEAVTGHEVDGNSEADAALWNRAWALARASWTV